MIFHFVENLFPQNFILLHPKWMRSLLRSPDVLIYDMSLIMIYENID